MASGMINGGLDSSWLTFFSPLMQESARELSAEESMRRARLSRARNLDRIESEACEFHRRVESEYRAIAEREPGRVKVIDACRSVDVIHSEIV
jgi:dTMP kinase